MLLKCIFQTIKFFRENFFKLNSRIKQNSFVDNFFAYNSIYYCTKIRRILYFLSSIYLSALRYIINLYAEWGMTCDTRPAPPNQSFIFANSQYQSEPTLLGPCVNLEFSRKPWGFPTRWQVQVQKRKWTVNKLTISAAKPEVSVNLPRLHKCQIILKFHQTNY